MMTKLLHTLYNGKLIPWERRGLDNSRQVELVNQLDAEEHYFLELLSKDDFKRYRQVSQLYYQLTEVNEEELFAYGFSVGMLMMQEVMEQKPYIFK